MNIQKAMRVRSELKLAAANLSGLLGGVPFRIAFCIGECASVFWESASERWKFFDGDLVAVRNPYQISF